MVTDGESPLPTADRNSIRALSTGLRQEAASAGERRALVLAGSADWTHLAAETALKAADWNGVRWLGRGPSTGQGLAVSDGEKLLGGEVDTLVYDAHQGMDPDSFGAALGALRGGGLLLLLTPPLPRWPLLPDPQAARTAVHPFRPEQVSGRFLQRFVQVLQTSPGVLVLTEGLPPPELSPSLPPRLLPKITETADDCRTPDQTHAVDAIVKTAEGRARRPLVLTSDRGRGKSSALGIAAGRLLREGTRRIRVTAPRRASVQPLFRHAADLLASAEVHTNRIDYRGSALEFLPPDALVSASPASDLLLVDEAAGIPAPILEHLLRQHPRVVFATTVHGYEGTGRGFEVRFRRTLDRLTPEWREHKLQTPIRWAAGDPLEAFVSRALLLDAAPAAKADILSASPATCHFECFDRDALVGDEPGLSQLFGLLVLAHYQTRPMDLRHLLDGPNVRVYALIHEGHIAATALVAIEGGFDKELARAAFEGRRRPQGHLLPQTLSAHAGIEEAARLRFARIVRIAVHPAARGRGLGRRLLDGILANAHDEGVDLAGASFGATADLLRFWARCGFPPVHLGTSRNAASGAHAAVVLRPLTLAGESLQAEARERLGERLPIQLAGPLRDLEPEIAACLFRSTRERNADLGAREWQELSAFAFTHRPYEAVLPPLVTLAGAKIGDALRRDLLSAREGDALITCVLQLRTWGEAAKLLEATGRAQIISLLRTAAGKLVGSFEPRNATGTRRDSASSDRR